MWKQISLFFLLGVVACSDPGTDIEGSPTGTSTQYDIWSIFNEEIGIVTLSELDDGSYKILVELSIPFSDPVSVDFAGDNALDGKTSIASFGTMDTGVTELEFSRPKGVKVSYDQMTEFDGHIAFHVGTKKLAFADIGENVFTNELIEYTMYKREDEAVFGMAYFRKRINDEGVVTIDLNGTLEGDNHPAHIHRNTNAQGGGIVIDLTYVTGETGMSWTNVVRANDKSPLDFDILKNYNGYITVHKSDDQFGTYIAQGDIGMNKLTGRSVEYDAYSTSGDGVTGKITLSERVSGNTLVRIDLENDNTNVNHPAHIHDGTAAEAGSIAISLSTIAKDEEFAITEVSALDNGTPITYDELIQFDGFVNIHFSANDLGTIITKADIGQNALTGATVNYPITQLNSSGMEGNVKFEERVNGQTLITITVSGAASQGHATHVHSGNAASGGPAVITLRNVDGTTGISASNITQQNNGNLINYSDLIQFDGHIVIHQNPTGDPAANPKIASGNVGING